MKRTWVLVPLLGLLAGCPVTQSQDTPVPEQRLTEPTTARGYWLYVPSDYSDQADWPLVITLHGTYGWDSSGAQVREWKALAEQKGFLVMAPDLRSTQGILPVIESVWREDLAGDERAVLAILEHVCSTFRVDRGSVLLTGFSAGGYPMYYIGLRRPELFGMLIARACNSRLELLEELEVTDRAQALPIAVVWGRDDLQKIHDDSWQAFRWLREHGFTNCQRTMLRGGHLRRPEIAYELWRDHLAPRHQRR